jgi:hypothetical protein
MCGALLLMLLTFRLLWQRRLGVEDRQGAHKLSKLNHMILLDVKQLKHLQGGQQGQAAAAAG